MLLRTLFTWAYIRSMRKARLRGDGQGQNFFHCLSRVVDKQYIVQDEEKELFVGIMRKLEAFLGLRVVTY